MGFDSKYGKVTTEYGDIPDDEPVFVFRAQDVIASTAIRRYASLCVTQPEVPRRHIELTLLAAEQFEKWREDHPDRVRLPNSEASREWLGDDVGPGLAQMREAFQKLLP
jgi:hypothetical protein